ncbi:ribulose-1,5-biphosphate synthetase [Anatilimnocola aggregata]|uniref:Ribulose-1,5-biphosphate synthetase n=1 Tax=Anatilimnocola aggregata TaxID=2528021 RepID=A0A517Y8P0_9BACT|nr:FAD-dependent oxidoreductase [Anatilimnocola aggregata]QDU26607.1 ribulose-1,5-biphosphate synthetase [Anatilimnocola aggregata]
MIDRQRILAAVVFLCCGMTAVQASDASKADVVVYGSTPGGVCAAIAAAREGASVILLEPTNHIGGLNTGGLSFSDSNQTVRSTVMGLFDEWHSRIERDYTERGVVLPYKVGIKDQSKWTYEPHVAARVTRQMLDEAGVTVLTNRYLQSVIKEGNRITSVVTNDGTFTAKVFVDATYEGDLLPAAGVSWTIGREGRAAFGESLAGKRYPKGKMNIDGFDSEGKPLPLITTTNAGPEDEGDQNVMVYSFRLCLTADPKIRVPFPKPVNYDPARFEVIRRFVQNGGKVGFDLYPLPGGKVDGNNSIGGQFSIGLVGGGNDWCAAGETGRKAIWEAHKQYTLEFYHFLTTDPAVPEADRRRFSALGLCRDEFADYGHFSPSLYVREGRRMKGMYVLSQKDILEEPEKEDPIVVSSFPIDSHDCQRVAIKDGGVINEGTIFPVRRKSPAQGYAYHVPYRSILPKPEECENLLVPVALSCTHVGISSIRVEPTWMILGQSAGIAAALAAKQELAVQKLPYPKLRERLLAQKQVLELPTISETESTAHSIDSGKLPGIVLDDRNAKLAGQWTHSTNFKPHIDRGYVYCGEKDATTKGDGSTSATFRFKSPKTGRYQLLLAYSAHESRANNVPVTVTSGSATKTLTVDQTKPLPAGKLFRPIDTIDLQAEVETTISISNANTVGFVIVDAIQLLPTE